MFRMWGKIFHENHMLKDTVICIDSDLNRTRKVYQALEEICYEFDLSKPLWLDHNKNYTVMLFITRQIQVLLKMVFSRYLKKFFYILTQHYMYLNTRLSIISLLYSVM